MRVSLRDAARLSGIPEEAIRRKILTGEIASVPVDDDRQYFVRLEDLGVATPPECGPRPKSCSPFFALKIALALFLLTMIAAIVTTTMSGRCVPYSLCVNCAMVRHDVGLHSYFESDGLSDVIQDAHPGPCRHHWVGLFPKRGTSLRMLAENLDHLGIVEAAKKVDPKGAADLVRWCLGRARQVGDLTEHAAFKTRDEFRAWFDALRARSR